MRWYVLGHSVVGDGSDMARGATCCTTVYVQGHDKDRRRVEIKLQLFTSQQTCMIKYLCYPMPI